MLKAETIRFFLKHKMIMGGEDDGKIISHQQWGSLNGSIIWGISEHLLRRNQRGVIEGIKDTKGIRLRPLNDPEGNAGICIMFYLDNKDKVKMFPKALRAEGIDAVVAYGSGIPDWHIYSHWKHIIEKKTPTPEGCPWICPYHKGDEVEYSSDINPNTLEYLSRIIHIDVPSQLTLDDYDMIAKGISKVAIALL
jgi:hypothetical protein